MKFPLLTRAIIVIVILLSFVAFHYSSPPDYKGREYLRFPTPLKPTTPYDVNLTLENKLVKENKIDEAQRLFDILAWQMFISLNWPRSSKGEPMPSIAGKGSVSWENWKESFEIFKEDGSEPEPWGVKEARPAHLKNAPSRSKVLFRASKPQAFHERHLPNDTADEIDQAFTAPIWDQNGNIVRYEIRLNKVATDYIISNELYNLDGQIAFSKASKTVTFPKSTRTQQGAMEIKAAWKIIDPARDIAERFFTRDVAVANEDGSFSKAKVGLVGMHIATRSESSPQWIWATFEHVDNLETNPLERHGSKTIHPSFNDPSCATCPINVFPDTTSRPVKNQVQRVLPIPPATAALNKEVQNLLKAEGSVWQYYQLIGSQWPTDPNAAPYSPTGNGTAASTTPIYTLPQSVENKSGGKPVPVYLTNMVMETYFQGGTVGGPEPQYNKFLGNEPAYFQMQGFPGSVDTKNTQKLIFGTESCMGCHYSSAIAVSDTISKINGKRGAVFGEPGTANFEWLLQLKANFKR